MLNLNYFVVRNKTIDMSFISFKRQILLAKSKVGYEFDKTEYFKVEIRTKNQLSLIHRVFHFKLSKLDAC